MSGFQLSGDAREARCAARHVDQLRSANDLSEQRKAMRFRCRCGKQFKRASADVLNKAQYPSDVIAAPCWSISDKRG
jgi:hypothetical protein